MSNHAYNHSYTHAQMVSQALTPKSSAFLSILGSTAMLLEIRGASSNARARSQNYAIDRLLLGMGITDLSFSAGWFLTTWPSPKENADWLWGASGNTQTCSAQAFFISLGFWGTPIYNTIISFYYRAMIEWNWTDDRLLRYDKYVHGAIWSAMLLRSSIYLGMKYFNAYGVICYVQSLPPDCNDDDCVRGDKNTWKIGIFEQIFPLWPCLLLNAYFMARVYWSIRKVAHRTKNLVLSPGDGLFEQLRHLKMQASLYVLVMYFCLVPDQIYVLIYFASPGRTFFNYWFETFAYMALPLQGYLNFLVYMRRKRRAHTSFGRVMMAPLRWKEVMDCMKATKRSNTNAAATGAGDGAKEGVSVPVGGGGMRDVGSTAETSSATIPLLNDPEDK